MSYEDVEDAKLLPCPFCASEKIDPEGWASTDRHGPACDDCGATAETVEIWNARPGLVVMTRKLTIEYHAGNPNLCRIPELTIRAMPECEGGGWYMPREQAEELVAALSAKRAEARKHPVQMSNPELADALDAYRSDWPSLEPETSDLLNTTAQRLRGPSLASQDRKDTP